MSTITEARPGYAYAVPESLDTLTCCSCGVLFAMTSALMAQRRSDGKSFWCPNGHSQHYTDTDASRLQQAQREIARERDRNAALAAERDQIEASRRALRGVATRYRNRLVAGECPACGQHLRDLARHIARKHPEGMPEEDR